MRMMESVLQRLQSIMNLEQIKKIAFDLNQQQCKPPLKDEEFEKQWLCALKFIQREETKQKNNQTFENDYLNLKESSYDNVDEEQDNKIEKIVNLIENRCSEIFTDQFNEINALVQINDHFETLGVDSYRFEKLVTLE